MPTARVRSVMRILLTNDDGINAPGLIALHKVLAEIDPIAEVFTVAPKTVQSATSHGVTFHTPLMVEPVSHLDGYAVDGRPADCVKVALSALWPERFGEGSRPDLVISGMNAGANCGVNVIYSGTVAAAIEAAFLGPPSLAVSMHLGRGRPLFDVGAMHARRAIEKIIETKSLGQHECLSINIPRCEEILPDTPEGREEMRRARAGSGSPGQVASAQAYEHGPDVNDEHDPLAPMPVSVCPMNTHGLIDRFERRVSPAGQAYYWSAAGGLDFHNTEPGTDVDLLFKRHITVTPLSFDLTAHDSLRHWQSKLGN